MNRKAQIRMTETVAVLFIFFVLVIFGIFFYYKYSQISILEKQQELLGMRAIDTTLKILFLPELSCTKGDAEPEDNCFDLSKLGSASSVFGGSAEHLSYYFDIFKYANITVHEIYPDSTNSWTIYDKPKVIMEEGREIKNWKDYESTFFIVTLREESEGNPKYRTGYLEVGVYS